MKQGVPYIAGTMHCLRLKHTKNGTNKFFKAVADWNCVSLDLNCTNIYQSIQILPHMKIFILHDLVRNRVGEIVALPLFVTNYFFVQITYYFL